LTLVKAGWGSSPPAPPNNIDSLTKISVDIAAIDEKIDYVFTALSSTVNSSVTTFSVLSSTGFNIGDDVVIGSEVVLIQNISGLNWTVARGQQGSTAASHTAILVAIYLVNAFVTEEIVYTPGEVLEELGTPGAYGNTIFPNRRWPIPGLRIAWFGLTPINDFGAAVNEAITPFIATVGDATLHPVPGLRTLYGGSLTLQTPGGQGPNPATLYVGSGVTDSATATTTGHPWFGVATGKTAPSTGGNDINITIYKNGTAWMVLTIPQGSTSSSRISAAELLLVSAGDMFTVDVTGVGTPFPGEGLIVTIQF